MAETTTLICEKCGAVKPAGAQFCRQCGTPLAQGPEDQATAGEPVPPSPMMTFTVPSSDQPEAYPARATKRTLLYPVVIILALFLIGGGVWIALRILGPDSSSGNSANLPPATDQQTPSDQSGHQGQEPLPGRNEGQGSSAGANELQDFFNGASVRFFAEDQNPTFGNAAWSRPMLALYANGRFALNGVWPDSRGFMEGTYNLDDGVFYCVESQTFRVFQTVNLGSEFELAYRNGVLELAKGSGDLGISSVGSKFGPRGQKPNDFVEVGGPYTTLTMPNEILDTPYSSRVQANGGLNIRQGPDTEYSVIGMVADGDTVLVHAYNTRRDWALVYYEKNHIWGWTSTEFLR